MTSNTQTYTGHILDIRKREIHDGEILVENGIIQSVVRLDNLPREAPYLLPGFIDAHIHIESSMMTPENFARVAVTHGVVCAVCDPHEITNVLGVAGIDYMLANARNSRFAFHFGLPSCVPSSPLETAGAIIDARQTRELLRREELNFLAEMMNYPGVLSADGEVMEKIAAAKACGKPIDGHAPGVKDADLQKYAAAGISTDHECATLEEARQRVEAGMKVIVREGSAARNFEALHPIIGEAPQQCMLCSDDKHPDDLIRGHIDALIRRGVAHGISMWDMLQAACITPAEHYATGTGLLQAGDTATFIAVDNLTDFTTRYTLIGGHCVYDREHGVRDGELTTGHTATGTPNNFHARPITREEVAVELSHGTVKVIEAFDGELFTRCLHVPAEAVHTPDIQKIMVYNRYGNGRPQIGFIRGFGLRSGAIGATIAHDSHNIVVIAATDEEMITMANALIATKGGVGVVSAGRAEVLPLPVAGLMSEEPAESIAKKYQRLDTMAKTLGCPLRAPFITMAFMALPVIPELKLTDKGLVDVSRFDFTELVTE